MSVLDFPTSPTNGQYYNGFIWNAANETWDSAFAPRPATIPITSPNFFINGAFDIWQRGTTINNEGRGPDRWALFSSSTAWTQSRDADVPAGIPGYSYKITNNSAKTANSTDYHFLDTRIEASNVSGLRWGYADAKQATLSFYVKSSVVGTYSGILASSNNSISYGIQYTISAANTWQRVVITVQGPTTGAGTAWLSDTNVGFWLKLDFGSGSNYKIGSAGSWVSGVNVGGVTGSATLSTVNGATFFLAGVQLEEGAAPTEFRRNAPSIQGELAACQRYYFRNTGGGLYSAYGTGVVLSSTAAFYVIPLPVEMRTSLSSSGNLEISNLMVNRPGLDIAITSVGASTTQSTRTSFCFQANFNSSGSVSVGQGVFLLNNNNASGYFAISAEL
jgi:hypothetical protein